MDEEEFKKVHEEDLLKESTHDDPPSSKRGRHVLILVSAVFMGLLMLSFVFIGSPLGGILQGAPAARTPFEQVLIHPDATIIFDNNTLEQLQELYSGEEGNEFPACLKGVINDGVYRISSLYIPDIIDRSFGHVRFVGCEDSIVMMHSHPINHCGASGTDLRTLRSTQEKNPDMIMLIMCGNERFSLYT